MNLQYRNLGLLFVNIHDRKSQLLAFQEEYYDNIYFVDPEGMLVDYIRLENLMDTSAQRRLDYFNENVTIDEVSKWFKCHPGTFRIPVLGQGKLIGEYFDADSTGNCLYKKIEDKALEILPCLKEDFCCWARGRHVGIIGDDKSFRAIEHLYGNVTNVNSYSNECDVTVDLSVAPQFRRILFPNSSSVYSLSEILIPLLIKKVSSFYQYQEVQFIAFDAMMKNEVPTIFASNLNRTLEEMLQDKACISAFCKEDDESYTFIKKHEHDLNQLSRIVSNGIHNILVDSSEDGFNIVDGKRFTVNVPYEATTKVHCFGPCIVQGLCVTDRNTIPSMLQRMILENGYCGTAVENHGISCGKDLLNDLLYMMATPVKAGDIVLWLSGFDKYEETVIREEGVPFVDLRNEADTLNDWFLNNPMHCNAQANMKFSKRIYEKIEPYLGIDSDSKPVDAISFHSLGLFFDPEAILRSNEMSRYISSLGALKYNSSASTTGCIVVNANPCTNGHLYLIRQALRKVDLLYVFLVEESKHSFSYLDREQMLKENFIGEERIRIISGGNVLTSELGFPEYFNRNQSSMKINPLLNHKIFALKIAPVLNISIRFFGSESDDEVTRTLNSTAVEYLPTHGVEVVIIPRLKIDGQIVSAKTVRKLYDDRDFQRIAKLVPYSTFSRLVELSGTGERYSLEQYNQWSICYDSLGYPIVHNNLSYPGMFHKFGLDINAHSYILKTAESDEEVLSLYSEKIGSHLCLQAGIVTSDIHILQYGGYTSLLSRSWLINIDSQFFPLASYYEELIDEYECEVPFSYALFKDIILKKCPERYDEILVTFWRISVIDFLLCNARSAGNIGFIDDGRIRQTPVYDNSTWLSSISDMKYKDMAFPRLLMEFEVQENSGYNVLRNFKDEYRIKVVEELQRAFDFQIIADEVDSPEEQYLLKVIKYRYSKLYES